MSGYGVNDGSYWWPHRDPETCPDAPHRWPQGPNEDVDICSNCGSGSWKLRPEGETFGDHLSRCDLPPRHEGYCKERPR